MAHLSQFLVPGIAVLAVLTGAAVVAAVARRRKAAEAATDTEAGPRSLVRVLRSDAELRDAVERAASFERMVADTLRTRARRYEAMVAPPLVAVPPLAEAPVTEMAIIEVPSIDVPLPLPLPEDAPRSA